MSMTVRHEDGVPAAVDTVLVSSQHVSAMSNNKLTERIVEEVIKKTIPAELIDKRTKCFVNLAGKFVVAGPFGDSGLTGRKIIVDT